MVDIVDATSAAMLGAGLGATGAILAQGVGAYLGGRRDSRRMNWEGVQNDRAAERDRALMFNEVKRQKYAEYIGTIYPMITATRQDRESWSTYDVHTGVKAAEDIDPRRKVLDGLRWDFQLIAHPLVTQQAEVTYALWIILGMQTLMPGEWAPEARKQTNSDALKAWTRLAQVMRADVAGDTQQLKELSKTFRDQSSASSPEPSADRPKLSGIRRRAQFYSDLSDVERQIARLSSVSSVGTEADLQEVARLAERRVALLQSIEADRSADV